MDSAARRGWRAGALAAAMALAMGISEPAGAQQSGPASGPPPLPAAEDETSPFDGRLVTGIRFEGLQRVSERLVRNNINSTEGRPLSWLTVRDDLRRLERLGQFREVRADLLVQSDQSVVIVFRLTEAPIVRDIQVTGNRQINDSEIATVVNEEVSLIAGIPIDDYRIGQARRRIEELYRDRGFYQVQVRVNEEELADRGYVIFEVREGERTRVKVIRFDGNKSFSDKQLRTQITTKVAGLLDRGPLDNQTLDEDVGKLVTWYRDRGYLDVRAARQITLAPNGKEAIVTFLIEEGPLCTLRKVTLLNLDRRGDAAGGEGDADPNAGLRVLSLEQIQGLMRVKPGDVYSMDKIRSSVTAIRDAYHQMGYVDARVDREELRVPGSNNVDLRLAISEGERYRAGLVTIKGNELTKSKVVRRHIGVTPDSWLDGTAAEESEEQINNTGLFARDVPGISRGPKVTIQPEDPANPGYRDVLVEVEETNTGSLSFGAAVSSDAGLIGLITLSQRNFDISDTPDSLDEFLRGRSFRGAGQRFELSLQPGDEQSTYSLSLAEPALFESDYGASASVYFRDREFSDYDEERYGTRWRLGRRFGTRWAGGLSLRGESIDLSDIDSDAPVDVFEVENRRTISGLGFDIARTSADNRFRPTKGTRTELSLEQIGALGGDFDFTRFTAEHSVYVTVDEDFLGRKTVVSLNTRTGYIFQDDEAPVYERFYLGGRNFRGFDFRGIGPLGIRNDTGTVGGDHVGGDFSFFVGIEYEKPVWEDMLAVVLFLDTGTLNDDLSFEDYRAAAGIGARIYLPQFGPAPLAFDFAFPLAKEETDDTQVFSFSVDIPF